MRSIRRCNEYSVDRLSQTISWFCVCLCGLKHGSCLTQLIQCQCWCSGNCICLFSIWLFAYQPASRAPSSFCVLRPCRVHTHVCLPTSCGLRSSGSQRRRRSARLHAFSLYGRQIPSNIPCNILATSQATTHATTCFQFLFKQRLVLPFQNH